MRSDEATWALEYLYDEKGTVSGGIYSAEGTSAAFLVVATDRGDVRELLDADGASFAFYSYDAYGNPDEKLSRATTQIPAALAAQIAERNVLRYAGYCYDEMSGLYYLSQRYYDAESACFISKDPARADGEESAYQYCAGDPVGSVDPSGEKAGKPLWGTWFYRDGVAPGYAFTATCTWSASVTWKSRRSYVVKITYTAPAVTAVWKGCRLSFWVNQATGANTSATTWSSGRKGQGARFTSQRFASRLEASGRRRAKSLSFSGSVNTGRVAGIAVHASMSFGDVSMGDAFSHSALRSAHQSLAFTNPKGKRATLTPCHRSSTAATSRYSSNQYRSLER